MTAVDTMVGLTKLRDRAVIAYEIDSASLLVVLSLHALRHITLVHALVIVNENARDIYAVRTWHTIFTVVTRYGRVALDESSRLALKPINLFLSKRFQRTE